MGATRKRKVFEVTLDDSGDYLILTKSSELSSLPDYLPDLKDLDDGSTITITVKRYSKEELSMLGDFNGF